MSMNNLNKDVVVQDYAVFFPADQVRDNPEIKELFDKAVSLGMRVDAHGTVMVPQPHKPIKISGTIMRSTGSNACSVCGGTFTGPHFCAGPDRGDADRVYRSEVQQ